MSTSQKVVVVTGASQGIGAEVVRAFRKLDYRIVATARSIKPSDDANILTVAGDIGDPETAQRVISEGVARFGRIDTLVNNAGMYIGKPFTQHNRRRLRRGDECEYRGFLSHHATRHRGNGKAFERPRG
jgi:NADP-dependent 3-hydroxy acid dehydrogenase YdfG